jgi:DNA-binding winged helix-turn-helix (wHTH) protein
VRAFDLLIAFVDRPGTLITKDDLLATVWPGLVVEENNLQVQVSTLRKIIGQSALATIPGRGYRFNLAVSRADAHTPAPPVDNRAPAVDESDETKAHPPALETADSTVARDDLAALPIAARTPWLRSRLRGIGKTRVAQAVAGPSWRKPRPTIPMASGGWSLPPSPMARSCLRPWPRRWV